MGTIEPGSIRLHEAAYPISFADHGRPDEHRDRRRPRRARRPLRARRRDRPPRRRLPHGGQDRARRLDLGGRAGARGPRDRAAGVGKTLEEKILALDENGEHPGGREAAGEVPAPGWSRSRACRARAQARARRSTTSSGSTRSRRCATAAEGAAPAHAEGLRRRRPRRTSSPRCRGRAGRRDRAPRGARPRARDRRADRRRAARAPGVGRRSSWPARRAAWPTPSRTSTSSPRPSDPAALVEALDGAAGDRVGRRLRAAPARACATHSGMKVDLRVVAPDQFGNLLQHFTGSKAHNVALRESAVRRGLHVSEYGVLDDATGETLRCATEEEVYAALGPRLHRAGAARGPRRARGGRGRRRRAAGADPPSATCAATCTATRRLGRQELDRGDGAGGAARRLPSTSRSPTTRRSTGFGDDVSPDAARAPDRAGARPPNAATRRDRAAGRQRGQHPARRVARLRRRAARARSTG